MHKSETTDAPLTSTENIIVGLDTGPDDRLLSDWFKIQRTKNSPVEGYHREDSLQFNGGWIDVRHWNTLRSTESCFMTQERSYYFDISLGPRPTVRSALMNLDGGEPSEVLNRIVMIPPSQKVHILACEGRYRTMRCMLDANLVDNILQYKAIWKPNSLRQAIHLSGGEIEWILMKMYREVDQREFGTSTVVESLARALAVEIIRRFELDKDAKGKPSTIGGLAPGKLRRLKERVNADQTPPDLAELAELCCMNVRHLNRAFREETGQSLGKYVKAITMERAHRLLVESDLSIKDIAECLGYATSGSFTHAYTNATGLKPSEVKRSTPD